MIFISKITVVSHETNNDVSLNTYLKVYSNFSQNLLITKC